MHDPTPAHPRDPQDLLSQARARAPYSGHPYVYVLETLKEVHRKNQRLRRRLAAAEQRPPAWWVWHHLDEPEPASAPAQDDAEGERWEEFDQFTEKAKRDAQAKGADPEEIDAMAESIKDTLRDKVDDIRVG